LKSEHNRRESELDKREAALREDERKVSEVVKRNQVLKNNLATAADSFDQLKSELTTHKGQLDGKLVEITSNLNTTVHKLSAIRGLFND
jgi:myosin heavy subunit